MTFSLRFKLDCGREMPLLAEFERTFIRARTGDRREPLSAITGTLSAITGTLSAFDRNRCPQSIGITVRIRRNPHDIALHDHQILGAVAGRHRVFPPVG
jgi:hypothetical protein